MREMTPWWLGFIILVAVAFAYLEVYGWSKYGTAGTLSAHVRLWTYRQPMVIFGLGIFLGWLIFHFWNATDMAKVASELAAH